MDFINLKNSDGKEITVRFRRFRPPDATAIVNLIREEYGDTYRKRKMYDANYIIQQCEGGNLNFYVAELDSGEVIGSLSISRNLPEYNACTIGTAIILKKYRGYKMFFPFAKYIAGKIRKMENVSAVWCNSLMYHDITQKLMYRLGFKPCGFIPSVTIAKNFQHSFERDENSKLTLGILIRKMKKHYAGKIYLPAEHSEIAKQIYSDLHLHFEISNEIENLRDKSEIIFSNDERQHSCTIEILSAGEDLVSEIQAIHSKYTAEFQTFNIFLNISDAKSIAAYNELKKLGYFFAGFQPICKQYEIMILHNPGNVEINFDTLKIIPAFENLKNYVKNCYESRCTLEKN